MDPNVANLKRRLSFKTLLWTGVAGQSPSTASIALSADGA